MEGGRGVRTRPPRRPKLAGQLPQTPERAPSGSFSSPCIFLHNEPLNTPAKSHIYQFGLLPPDCPDRADIPEDLEEGQAKNAGRKSSFQRAVDVNRETLENTKLNSGYSSVEIVKEIVRVGTSRPPSPSSKFVAGKGSRHHLSKIYSIPDEAAGCSSCLRFSVGGDQRTVNEPPYYDTRYPLKPIIKKNEAADWSRGTGNAPMKERVVVKRIVYADEEDIFNAPVAEAGAKKAPASKQAVAPQKQQTKLNGPARRIVR